MACGADLRRIALSLPGTVEAPHFDRAAFKVVRTYATLAADGRSANVKFTSEHQEFKCMVAPDAYQQIANAWGRQGWTQLDLSKLSEDQLRIDLKAAHTAGASKKPARRVKRRAAHD